MCGTTPPHLLPVVAASDALAPQLSPQAVDLLAHLGHLSLPPFALGDAQLEEVLLQLFLDTTSHTVHQY